MVKSSTEKEVKKKTTPKTTKSNDNKKTEKKVTKVVKEEKNIKVEKVEDEGKKKVKKEHKFLNRLNKFMANPKPLVIFLLIVCAVLVLYIANYNKKNRIFVGEVNKNDVQIVNVHYFTNGDMNYFYASPAAYVGEDKEIYNFQVGYYVVDKNGNYIEFAARSRELTKSSSLKEVLEEMSGWNFAAPDGATYFFSDVVIKNIDNLHFVLKASTEKDSKKADIEIDYPVEMTKITK